MPTTNVRPVSLAIGCVYSSPLANPGTSSGGAVTFASAGLLPSDLADAGLEIVLTVEMQFEAGGDYQSQPGAECDWRGGPSVAAPPTVSCRNPYYRRARCRVEASRPCSVGIDATTP